MPRISAAVCHAFGEPLSIEEVELAAPASGEVEVEMGAVAICHSDLSFIEGGWGGTLPAVYGHEAAGTITAIGPNVKEFAVGERVAVTLIRSCDACVNCASGHPALCTTQHDADSGPLSTADGGLLHQGMACGAFAEKVVVKQSQIVKLHADIAFEAACLLSCGVVTGIGAVVNSARLRPGEDVVVIGAGGVGLNVIQGAFLAGARRIVAVDLEEDKLHGAREFGATDTVLVTDDAPWEEAQALLGRKADAVFVAVGVSSVYDTATHYIGRGGRMVMVGLPHSDSPSTYEPSMVASDGQSLIGSKMGDVVLRRDIPWMMDLYEQNRLKLNELVSKRWRLDQINEAIASTKAGHARRNVIVFGSGF